MESKRIIVPRNSDTEADTCRKEVTPRLYASEWKDEHILEQRTFTDGKIVVLGKVAKRQKPKKADYILRIGQNFPIAVIEAKKKYKTAAAGLQQAKDYAETLDCRFAYATNGTEIVEFDFITGLETVITKYPTPQELWNRLHATDPVPESIKEILLKPLSPNLGKSPRYYQEIAINRAVQAILEAKPLPYLLCQMNLLLHGLEYPNIDSGNSLRTPLRDIGDRDRVDIIITNPPFGGEEERGILNNFPDDMRTAETAMLFLQLIMRRLKRAKPGTRGGRAAVVVPNGTLFADGIAARIKEQMMKEYNLHTVVRLPDGVFEPYTSIPSNLLFFEQGKPTQDVWFYEIQPPAERKKYSKTKPIQFEEFATCIAWWNNREENENAWCIPAADILQYDAGGKLLSANLDRKNPNRRNETEYAEPAEAIAAILEKEKQIVYLLDEIKHLVRQ